MFFIHKSLFYSKLKRNDKNLIEKKVNMATLLGLKKQIYDRNK